MAEDLPSVLAALERADTSFLEGRVEEAEAAYRKLLAERPADFMVLVRLGQVLEHQKRAQEAVAVYEAAIAANPGNAFAFTRLALLLFRRAFGPAPAARSTPSGAARITMSTLGANGRFGNQLLQYGFLRMYGAEHGLSVEAPDWIGRDLFDLDDPLLAGELPPVRETEVDLVASLNRQDPRVWRNADLWGYCCYPTGALRRYRDRFRGLFRPGRRVAPLVAAAEARLRERGDNVVAVHLRRGDFGQGRYWIAESAWYEPWLDELWQSLDRPVLYVATDDAAIVAELARYRPVRAADLAVSIPGAEVYPDFHLLSSADALAISNSTFSFAAALLNTRAHAFMRPDRDGRRLVRFEPWDSPVFT
jgi:hypothetical protein